MIAKGEKRNFQATVKAKAAVRPVKSREKVFFFFFYFPLAIIRGDDTIGGVSE